MIAEDLPQQLKSLVLSEIPAPPPVWLQGQIRKNMMKLLADEIPDTPVVAEHGIEHEKVLCAVVLLFETDNQHRVT